MSKFNNENRFPETEYIKTHYTNLIKELGNHLTKHLNLEVMHYSHSEHIELGGSSSGPRIALVGPAIDPSGDLGSGHFVVNVGTNEAGQVKTRSYDNVVYIDMTYDMTIITMNPLDLVQYCISTVGLFRSNAFFKVDDRRYKIWRITYPSVENVINRTNQSMAKGRFQIRGIPVVMPFDVLKSGRVYSTNYDTQALV